MHLFTVLNYYKHADIDKKKMYKTCLGQETRFSYVQIQYKTVHTQILIFLIKKKKKGQPKDNESDTPFVWSKAYTQITFFWYILPTGWKILRQA